MIEKRLNELNRRRYQAFKSQKRSVVALFILLVVSFFSFTAELWANSKPLVMKYRGATFFPVFKDYHASEFEQEGRTVPDYRALEMSTEDWIVWPVINWDPYESNKLVASYPSEPTGSNIMGTDDRGRDVFARLLFGFRYSIAYAVLVWVLSVILGASLGGTMGYVGGWTDLVGQRFTEILSSIPYLFLLIILVSIFQPTLWLLILLTSVFGWISISYYVRGEFLKNRKMDFVEAARAMGGSHARIIFRHILPNSLTPIITFSPFLIAGNITGLAALDYLGFGLQQPTPSWGELLNQAQKHFTFAWWLAVYPAGALCSTLILLSMVGEGVRAAFDPRKGTT